MAGAIRGLKDLVEGWREDLDRYHRDERTELGKAHGERAREIERGWGKFYRNKLVEAERRAWTVRETMKEREREQTRALERARTITRIVVPRPPQAAPRPRARRGRVRAMSLDVGIPMSFWMIVSRHARPSCGALA